LVTWSRPLAPAPGGLFYDPTLWAGIGLIGGPFVGATAAAVVGVDKRSKAVGSGLLAGVLAADGGYGLTVVRDTTSPVYWTMVIVLAVVVLALVAIRSLRSWHSK
jgi:cytochrome c biogenesis protein ResB